MRQVLNDWPTIEFSRNIIALYGDSPLAFVLFQAVGMHPFNLPIWLAGLYLFSQRGRPYRMMGIIFVSVFILLIVQGTRAYYLHVADPMLFAGGAVLIESFAERGKWRGRILKPLIVTALVVVTLPLLALGLPFLPPQQVLAYTESSAGAFGIPADQVELLPSLADRLCWEEFVAEVARVHETLPEEDRRESVTFTGNYAEAGAIDLFGKEYGLPPQGVTTTTTISGGQATHHGMW